jgi:hypothetical protein
MRQEKELETVILSPTSPGSEPFCSLMNKRQNLARSVLKVVQCWLLATEKRGQISEGSLAISNS